MSRENKRVEYDKERAAERAGIAEVDPVTGEPLTNYLVDPMAYGIGDEVTDSDEQVEDELAEASAETNQGVRIVVDIKDPEWREKLKEAYIAVLDAKGIPHGNGRKTVLLKGDPSLLEGIDFVDKRPK